MSAVFTMFTMAVSWAHWFDHMSLFYSAIQIAAVLERVKLKWLHQSYWCAALSASFGLSVTTWAVPKCSLRIVSPNRAGHGGNKSRTCDEHIKLQALLQWERPLWCLLMSQFWGFQSLLLWTKLLTWLINLIFLCMSRGFQHTEKYS